MPKLFQSQSFSRSTIFVLALLCCAGVSAQDPPQACLIETIAGGGRSFSGDGGPALEAEFDGLTDAVAASDGTIFAADSRNSRVRRIAPDGVVTTLAGPEEGLVEPTRLAIAPAGAVLAYDGGARRIWRISSAGRVETLLDLRLARMAHLGADLGLAVGADGAVYIAAPDTNRVWRLEGSGEVSPFAGTGATGSPEANGDGGPAVMATLNEPRDVDVGPDGLIYIAETGASRVRRVNADGTIETALSLLPSASATGASYASFLLGSIGRFELIPPRPLRIAVGDGWIDAVVAGTSLFGGSIPSVIVPGIGIAPITPRPLQPFPDITGLLSPYEATVDSTSVYRYLSDGEVLIVSLGLPNPRSVARMPDDRALLVDPRDQLWLVTPDPDAVRDLSGLGVPVERPERIAGIGANGSAGDGGPASEARLFSPREVVARRSGEIFIADETRMRWIDRSGTIRALPGDLPNARLAVDPKDNVYIATNDEIFRLRASGLLEQIAAFERCESPEAGCGDGGPASNAKFFSFGPIAAGSDGTLYLLESGGRFGYSSVGPSLTPEKEQIVIIGIPGSNRVRTISPNGVVGTADPTEQIISDSPAIGPDAAGGILLSSSFQSNLLRIAGPSRQVATGSTGYVDSPFHASPSGLVGAPDGTVYFSRDRSVRRLLPDGTINTIAGSVGRPGYSGDGGPATEALVTDPAALALTGAGDLLIADPGAGAVRIVRDPASCDPVVRPQIQLDGVQRVRRPSSGFGFAVSIIPISRITPSLLADPVAPGSLISIFGTRLGPTPVAEVDLASLDRLPTEQGGVSVEIDGRPAPLLFASNGQINAVVPAETTSAGQAYLRVTVNGVASHEAVLQMQPSAPGVLALLNADGSPNTEAAPALPGEEVTLLVSGLGVEGAGDPGVIAREKRTLSTQGITIERGETEVAVESVETAPGFPQGVLAVKFHSPANSYIETVSLRIRQGAGQWEYFSVNVQGLLSGE